MKKLICVVAVSMLWGCGDMQEQGLPENALAQREDAALASTDPLIGFWSWTGGEFKLRINTAGEARLDTCGCNYQCWPTGTVYVHSLTYASTASDGRIHYSAKIFAGDSATNCSVKTYTNGRATLSANKQTMVLQWLDGSGYTETYNRI